MTLIRNWRGVDKVQNEGLSDIHDIGWLRVLVKRTVDNNPNVGLSAELDTQDESFEIKARIDPANGKQDAQLWLGLVEEHILPLMKKSDRWFTQKPNDNDIQVYRVLSVDNDEIMLTREY